MNDELKERVKALAVDAGGVPSRIGSDGLEFMDDDLVRFAQAVAHDCAGVVMGILVDCETRDVDDPPLHETAQAIRARYGLGD